MQKIIYKARHIIEACTEEMTLKCSRLFSLGNMRLAVFFLLSFFGAFNFFVFSKIPTLSVDYLYNHKIILFEQIKPSLYASIHMSIQHTGLSGAPSAGSGEVPASGLVTPSRGANLRHHSGFRPLPWRLEKQTPL